jgi:glycosyltransferase involved in cell wall biosynthesis
VNVQRRIRDLYGFEAEVVHPPVDTERFTPRARGERLLVVSRLLQYKRVDLIVQAATEAGLPLDVIGTGPQEGELRAMAGPSVTFHGRVDDGDIVEMMESCRALVVAGIEDFGIVSVEAQAAGKPVVAFAAGGSLETVEDGVTGALFYEHSVGALVDALGRTDALDTSPEDLAAHTQRFTREAFRDRLLGLIGKRADQHTATAEGMP